MKLVYFAWVRERVGRAEEEVDLPASVDTAGGLVSWLASRGPEFEHAFGEPKAIRVAIDHVHARPEQSLAGAREIALFPPMTGG